MWYQCKIDGYDFSGLELRCVQKNAGHLVGPFPDHKKKTGDKSEVFLKTMIYWTPNIWVTDGHLGKSLISANQTSSHWGDNRVLEILLALSFKRNEGMHKTNHLPVESPLSEKRFVKVWHLPQSMGWKNKTHSKPRPSFTMFHIYLRIPYDVIKKNHKTTISETQGLTC